MVSDQKSKRKSPRKVRRDSKVYLRKVTYQSWHNMLQRCYNDKHVSFIEYGGRGICVWDLWRPVEGTRTHAEAFTRFLTDVGLKPTYIHTLDRISAHKHYTPDNVKWSTPKEQGVNKRNTHFVKHPKTGVRIAAATLADEMKITYQQLRARMMKHGTWYELMRAEYSTTAVSVPMEGIKK